MVFAICRERRHRSTAQPRMIGALLPQESGEPFEIDPFHYQPAGEFRFLTFGDLPAAMVSSAGKEIHVQLRHTLLFALATAELAQSQPRLNPMLFT